MLFAINCHDKPNHLQVRLALREKHLAYLATYGHSVMLAGPLLDGDGRPCGSLLIVDVVDRAAAEGFAAADPYSHAGLFESSVVRAFRPSIQNGEHT